MELDSSTLVYIVAIIVYFLYSTFFRKKNPQEAGRQEEQGERRETPPQQTASFDDLLKKIRREQGELEQDLEGQEEEEVDREWESKRKKEWKGESEYSKPVTEKRRNHDPQPQTYQEARPSYYNEKVRQEKSYEAQPLVKLDDQVDLESTEKILGEVEDVAGERVGSNRYGNLLKNPETVREAIVVAEILNRKHFDPLR